MLRHLHTAALLAAGALLCGAAWADPTISVSGCAPTNVQDPATSYPGKSLVISVLGTDCFETYNPAVQDLSYINSVTIADLNQDGWLDMLISVSSAAGGGVQLLLNDTTGSDIVVYKSTLNTGAVKADSPNGVAAVDVNGDGWPDVVTSNGVDGSVSVLLNDRAGGFGTAQVYTVGTSISDLNVVDVNGDGHPDIVVADTGNAAVDVLTNTGNGTFGAATVLHLGANADVLVLADVNNDKALDILTANSADGNVQVLLNDGHGHFASPVPYATGLHPDSLLVQDENGDGLPDIVAYDFGAQTFNILLNNGNGSFTAKGVTSYNNLCGSCVDGAVLTVGTGNLGATLTNAGPTVMGLVGANAQVPSVSGSASVTLYSSGSPAVTGGGSGAKASTTTSSSGSGALDWLTASLLFGTLLLRRRR